MKWELMMPNAKRNWTAINLKIYIKLFSFRVETKTFPCIFMAFMLVQSFIAFIIKTHILLIVLCLLFFLSLFTELPFAIDILFRFKAFYVPFVSINFLFICATNRYSNQLNHAAFLMTIGDDEYESWAQKRQIKAHASRIDNLTYVHSFISSGLFGNSP